jgi:hypothetical protein
MHINDFRKRKSVFKPTNWHFKVNRDLDMKLLMGFKCILDWTPSSLPEVVRFVPRFREAQTTREANTAIEAASASEVPVPRRRTGFLFSLPAISSLVGCSQAVPRSLAVLTDPLARMLPKMMTLTD